MNELKIEYLPVSALKPYEKNPRKNEEAVKYVRASIEEFGWRVPIVVDRNMVIIAGHTRYKAAKQMGLKEVPCVIADDLTEEQAAAFRLADNRVAEMAAWDEELLKEEMAKAVDFEFGDYGFDQKDIDRAVKEELGIKTHKCPRCGMEWTAREV